MYQYDSLIWILYNKYYKKLNVLLKLKWNPDLCYNVKCYNGGMCEEVDDTVLGFRCVCTDDYTGPRCKS